jgi:transposase
VRHVAVECLADGDLQLGGSAYSELRGDPPYHPGMMVALLLYAYSEGVYMPTARASTHRGGSRGPARSGWIVKR